MAKRVFIIHGWDGYPEEGCFPWLKKELTQNGFQVSVPAMPDPLHPEIASWVSYITNLIGTPDANTFLIGHSIGTQTILRYLETLDPSIKIGGVVLLAPWLHLTPAAYADQEDADIANPWLNTPIDWDKVKLHTTRFTAIFSDNDPVVPLSDSKLFQQYLNAEIIIEHNKGHFSGTDGIKTLPSALKSLLDYSK